MTPPTPVGPGLEFGEPVPLPQVRYLATLARRYRYLVRATADNPHPDLLKLLDTFGRLLDVQIAAILDAGEEARAPLLDTDTVQQLERTITDDANWQSVSPPDAPPRV